MSNNGQRSRSAAYVQAEGVVFDRSASDPLVKLPGGERIALGNDVAVMIFDLCASPVTIGEITEHVTDAFEVDRERAALDVSAFVSALAEAGALRTVDADGA